MVSLPIPYKNGIPYGDIRIGLPEFDCMGSIVAELTKGRITAESTAHLDPDLASLSIHREGGWKGTFGQSFLQQSHLDKNHVGRGDLFLFFGLFCNVKRSATGKLQFIEGELKHVIFGWLMVDQKYRLPDKANQNVPLEQLPTWARYHPHVQYAGLEPNPNALYAATSKLDCDGSIPGWGLFPKFKDDLCLSHPNLLRDRHGKSKDLPSLWRLPAWMYPWQKPQRTPMTQFRNQKSWSIPQGLHTTLDTSKGRKGQESILNSSEYPEAWPWAVNLIKTYRGLIDKSGAHYPF